MLVLDAEKACDSVDWLFLYKALETFQFHKKILFRWYKHYDKPSAKIQISGGLSNSFYLERGC